MGHSVLPQGYTPRPFSTHRTQTVVRVGKPKPGHSAGKPNRGMQEEPPPQRHPARTTEETATENIVCVAVFKRVDQMRDIRWTVLAVGVERHNRVGPLLKCELDPRL